MKLASGACILVAIGLSANALGQNAWVEFGRNEGSTAYFDQSSIAPDLSREVAYFAWWKSVLDAPSTIDGKQYSSHLSSYRVDCMRRTLQQREMYLFSPAGKQVSYIGASGETLPAAGTLGNSFVNSICARAGR